MYNIKYSKAILVYVLCTFFSFLGSSEGLSQENMSNVHWVFCIDTSGSMKTKGHTDLLKAITDEINNNFININKAGLKAGDRITLLSFDEDVRIEATALYQTQNDLTAIKEELAHMNNRSGRLTFISEAIVRAIGVIDKYDRFFHTNALYVFTDGKSEPYSPKWSKKRIAARKKRDVANFNKISLLGKNHGTNVWVGVLKWEAFEDAKTLVKSLGKAGHLVDLTDFSRLPLSKALSDFAQNVRTEIKLTNTKDIDLGTIPYESALPYRKKISLGIQTDNHGESPSIMGRINFEPDNPSEITKEYPLKIDTTTDKMVLDFEMVEARDLEPGIYKGKLNLFPSENHFGTMIIEPSQFDVEFTKASYLSHYIWRGLLFSLIGLLLLSYLIMKMKKRMPIKL